MPTICYLYDQSEINENTYCECLIFSGKLYLHKTKEKAILHFQGWKKFHASRPVQKLLCAWQAPQSTIMAGKASPKVGAKRSRDEESDDADAKKSEAKVAKEEEPTVENGADEKESTVVKGAADTKPLRMRRRRTQSLRPCPVRQRCRDHQWVRWIRGLRIRETRWRGVRGRVAGGRFRWVQQWRWVWRVRQGCRVHRRRLSALSSVFGDANKPKQLFGKTTSADDAGGDDDDDAAPESTPAETKPVITLQQEALPPARRTRLSSSRPTERCTSSSPKRARRRRGKSGAEGRCV